MNGLFFLTLNNFISQLTPIKLSLICSSAVAFLTILCTIISLTKKDYTLLKRLWIVFDFVGICLIEFWFEMQIEKSISYLFLTVGVCFLGLSICLFLPVKRLKISEEKRMLAQFLDRCAKSQKYKQNNGDNANLTQSENQIKPSNVLSSPIISVNQNEIAGKSNHKTEEIDFSHIKNILARLEYYPLTGQDKKCALELEKAILDAEENGLDKVLKQTINEGLGALLRIMAKYAV